LIKLSLKLYYHIFFPINRNKIQSLIKVKCSSIVKMEKHHHCLTNYVMA
jgi:hypothetical protein